MVLTLSLATVLGCLAAGAAAVAGGKIAGTIIDEITKEAKKEKFLNENEVNETAEEIKDQFKKENEDLFNTDDNNETPPEDKDKTQITMPPISSESTEESGAIKDGTDENTGTTTITSMDWIKKIEEWRDNDRAREDQIRAETQAREDTAWQRGIEDLRKSGANINLIAAQPAQSGGGITSATGVNTSVLTNNMNNEIKEMLQILEQDFKGSENDKDRFMHGFSNLMSFVGILIAIAGRK